MDHLLLSLHLGTKMEALLARPKSQSQVRAEQGSELEMSKVGQELLNDYHL